MVSALAWTVLEPIIGDICEALPVVHPFKGAGKFFLLHVLRTIDALDESKSEVERRSIGDSRIRQIFRYSFRLAAIEGVHIFKLPNKSGSGLIIDDVFRDVVELNGLRGLRFRELTMAD